MQLGKQQSSRILGLDLARVLAILFMVQGHTLDVLLSPEYRQGTLFDFWLFLRGLTAPMFLLLAGFSFTVVTTRRWDENSDFAALPWRRLTRFAMFIAIGYLMHMPVRSLADLPRVDAAGWQNWLQVDVLQCVGLTLMLLQILVLLAKTPARFATVTLGLGSLVVLITPLAWSAKWIGHLPAGLAAYFNGNTGSLFPLFPWAGYVLLGAATGYAYLQWRTDHGLKWFAIAGATLLAMGFSLEALPPKIYGEMNFWRTSPTLFFLKFGGVLLLLPAIVTLAEKLTLPTKAMRAIAQESLFVYVVHILIVYGSSWNIGLRQSMGPTLAPLPTLAWIFALLVSMTALALAWNWCKRTLPSVSRDFAYSMVSRLSSQA